MDRLVIDGHEVVRESLRARPPTHLLQNTPKFRTVKGWEGEWDDSGSLLLSTFDISLKVPVYLAIHVEEDVAGWAVTLSAVAPAAMDPLVLDTAVDFKGADVDHLPTEKEKLPFYIDALVAFGAAAPLARFKSKLAKVLVQAAMQEAGFVQENLKAYLDMPVNALCVTGWDLLSGLIPYEPPQKRDTRIVVTPPVCKGPNE